VAVLKLLPVMSVSEGKLVVFNILVEYGGVWGQGIHIYMYEEKNNFLDLLTFC